MPLENNIWHVRVELYKSSLQHIKLKKCQKENFFLNHDSATALLSVSFIMCFHIFLFLYELSSCVISFVVGAILVPFKYIGNETWKNCIRYTTLTFFILFFVTYIKHLRFINLFLCGDIEINPGPFNQCKSISFYHWNLNDLLARNGEKFHPVEAFVYYYKHFLIHLLITFVMD